MNSNSSSSNDGNSGNGQPKTDKLLQLVTLAKRAGKLVLGHDVVCEALKKGEAYLLLMASDVSEKTKKEVLFLSDKYECDYIVLPYTLDMLWYSIGKRVGIISVSDGGFAEKLKELSVYNS